MLIINHFIVYSALWLTLAAKTMCNDDLYMQRRHEILSKEQKQTLGGQLNLNPKEEQVNAILLREKVQELQLSYTDSTKCLSAINFIESQPKIQQSAVFKILRQLPKGASLHTHLLAAVNVDFLIENLTYRDNLYGRFVNGVFKLKFFKVPPSNENWELLKDLRLKQSDFDKWLRSELVLASDSEEFHSVEEVWRKFKKIFSTLYDMLSYRPVFQDFLYQALQELYDDNVIYGEFKGTIMQLYELDGTVHSGAEFFVVFQKTVETFKKNHGEFQGARYIHSIYRGVDDLILQNGLQEIIEMKKAFPDLIAGFDFVGYEEEGHTLLHYRKLLQNASKYDLDFYFHAGETNWQGHTDLNILDAILMRSKRIGHGFSIVKHPEILKLAKGEEIPLEICPISNQVLMLVKDQRNHPAAQLIAQNYPLVVCNDDPAIWNASGLSYDWYVVFMGMTAKDAGLKFLKQLALNSVRFSFGVDTSRFREVWEGQWGRFLDNILEELS